MIESVRFDMADFERIRNKELTPEQEDHMIESGMEANREWLN